MILVDLDLASAVGESPKKMLKDFSKVLVVGIDPPFQTSLDKNTLYKEWVDMVSFLKNKTISES